MFYLGLYDVFGGIVVIDLVSIGDIGGMMGNCMCLFLCVVCWNFDMVVVVEEFDVDGIVVWLISLDRMYFLKLGLYGIKCCFVEYYFVVVGGLMLMVLCDWLMYL